MNGHTDSDPISKTKSRWKDNLDLSAERARVVGKYLADKGVPAKQLGNPRFRRNVPAGRTSPATVAWKWSCRLGNGFDVNINALMRATLTRRLLFLPKGMRAARVRPTMHT